MNSSSTRLEQERRKRVELEKQLAILQAQLKETASNNIALTSPKRKKPETAELVPATPSKRKKRRLDPDSKGDKVAKQTPSAAKPAVPNTTFRAAVQLRNLAPSSVLSKLADLNNRSRDCVDEIHRSSAFTEKPLLPLQPSTLNHSKDFEKTLCNNVHERDDRLALVEELEPGPYEHKAPFDDPHFERLEPNSGIRLKSRTIPDADIQEYLTGRFYLSPSRLYSIIRMLPNKQGYDVPVAGDWVTIAVVAERGPIKFSRAPVGIGGDDDDGNNLDKADAKRDKKSTGKPKVETVAKTGKKYVNIKLIDFSARSRSGGKPAIRGDAFLNLLLFEADSHHDVTGDNGKRQTLYKGGSRGAFEAMSKLKEGDVIALLNPRVLKPFQGATHTPHPVNNILAITPESASSIIVIGRAQDLGMCTVMKRDGKLCGSWCDKRISDVCEWHVQKAVENKRAGRAEFSACSSGMSMTAAQKRRPSYDPARQWGLKPEGPGTTYCFSGHVVNSAGLDSRSLFITENIGREGQSKANSQMKRIDGDRELQRLLERDKEGMAAVLKAREVMESSSGCSKERIKGDRKSSEPTKAKDREKAELGANGVRRSYTTDMIRHLGFDPALKLGQQRSDDSTHTKLEVLASAQASRKNIELGPRPGPKLRSVFAPVPSSSADNTNAKDQAHVACDGEVSEGEKLVDLDESENET